MVIGHMRSLLVLSVILLLSGCIGGETRPSKFYSLSATEATQSGTLVRSGGMGLRLGPFTFPDYLRRPNITTHTSGNKVEVDEYNRWAGSLEDDFHRVLGINIGALLSSGNINVYPADSRIDAKYQVAGEINAFDGKLGETVTLDIRWFVEDTKSGKTVSSKQSVIVEPIGGNDHAALVLAQSRAVGKLSRDIAETLKGLEGKK